MGAGSQQARAGHQEASKLGLGTRGLNTTGRLLLADDDDVCGGTAEFGYSETVPGLSCDDMLIGALAVGIPGSVRDELQQFFDIADLSFACGTPMITSSSAKGCSYRDSCTLEIPEGYSVNYVTSIASQGLSSKISDAAFSSRRVDMALKGTYTGARDFNTWGAGMAASGSVTTGDVVTYACQEIGAATARQARLGPHRDSCAARRLRSGGQQGGNPPCRSRWSTRQYGGAQPPRRDAAKPGCPDRPAAPPVPSTPVRAPEPAPTPSPSPSPSPSPVPIPPPVLPSSSLPPPGAPAGAAAAAPPPAATPPAAEFPSVSASLPPLAATPNDTAPVGANLTRAAVTNPTGTTTATTPAGADKASSSSSSSSSSITAASSSSAAGPANAAGVSGTPSDSNGSGGGASRTPIIAGVAAGVGACLLAAAIAGVVVVKRRKARQQQQQQQAPQPPAAADPEQGIMLSQLTGPPSSKALKPLDSFRVGEVQLGTGPTPATTEAASEQPSASSQLSGPPSGRSYRSLDSARIGEVDTTDA